MQIIDWLRDHDEDAHRIALAGQAFAQRHLTRPGRLCYLRKLLHTYASLLRCSDLNLCDLPDWLKPAP